MPVIESAPAREPAQTTLSTIGDLSIAVADACQPPRRVGGTRVLAALLFCIFVYGLFGVAFASFTVRGRAVAPLFLSIGCGGLFWLWRRAVSRAGAAAAQLSATRSALERLAHEASNASNVIRANLIGYELEREYADRHLREVQAAVERLCRMMKASER